MYGRAYSKGLYGRNGGLGEITCLRTDAAGNCTLIRDPASDVTVDVRDGDDVYRYTLSGKEITFGGGQSFTEWLNANGRNVALIGGAALLLVMMTRR